MIICMFLCVCFKDSVSEKDKKKECPDAPICIAVPNGMHSCECDPLEGGCLVEDLPKTIKPAQLKVQAAQRDCEMTVYKEDTVVTVTGCKLGWSLITSSNQTIKDTDIYCINEEWSFNGQKITDVRCLSKLEKEAKQDTKIGIFGLVIAIPLVLAVLIMAIQICRYRKKTYIYRNLQRLSAKNVKRESMLGCGNFGEVWKATLHNTKEQVVVKILKESATDREEKLFREEALLMARFNHENIIKTRGICLETHPIMLALEFMNGGSVDHYLKCPEVVAKLNSHDLMHIVLDALKACIYLESEGYIHRDLAARNCLVQTMSESNLKPRKVKLTDFGLAKDISSTNFYSSRDPYNNPLPIAWTSPEAFEGNFSPKSDVWAFGVVIWEVFSWGGSPFRQCCLPPETHYCPMETFTNSQIEQIVCFQKKTLVDFPDPCGSEFTDSLKGIMAACWSYDAQGRPGFKRLEKLLIDAKSDICKGERHLSDETQTSFDRSTRMTSGSDKTGHILKPMYSDHIPSGAKQIKTYASLDKQDNEELQELLQDKGDVEIEMKNLC